MGREQRVDRLLDLCVCKQLLVSSTTLTKQIKNQLFSPLNHVLLTLDELATCNQHGGTFHPALFLIAAIAF